MKLRLVLGISIGCALALPLLAFASPNAGFSDVPRNAWFSTYVSQAVDAGIVSGYKDQYGRPTGSFGPENKVTVGEALKISLLSAGYDENLGVGYGHWAARYLSIALGERFEITQRNPQLNLDRPATRAEVASMFADAFRVPVPMMQSSAFADVSASDPYAPAVNVLAQDNVVGGDTDASGHPIGRFRPWANINRAETVKIAMEARAVYSQPGTSSRSNVSSSSSSSSSVQAAVVVLYTDTGFTPSVVHIHIGDTVLFKNTTFNDLRVASNPHPVHTDYSGFDSGTMFGKDGEYSFTFTRAGTFGYHNHQSPDKGGQVMVE